MLSAHDFFLRLLLAFLVSIPKSYSEKGFGNRPAVYALQYDVKTGEGQYLNDSYPDFFPIEFSDSKGQVGSRIGENTSALEYLLSAKVPEKNRKCMDWQIKYLHSMKAIESNARLIYHSSGGLSDSLTGMVSSFLISYALRRPFYISSDNVLREAIVSPVIRIAESHNPSEKEANLYYLHKKSGMNLIFRLSKNKMVKQEIHLTGNRGSVYKIVNSKEFRSFDRLKLQDVGTEFAFGCLLNLLAVPTKNILTKFSTELTKLRRKDVYKIGLQIRTFETLRGAKERTDQEYLKMYEIYGDCVKNLGMHRKKVLVYVISDSNVLRQTFVQYFMALGYDSFTTSVGMSSILAPWWQSKKENDSGRRIDEKMDVGPAEAAFAESYLYSLNDAYVYTKKSGFGRVGAASGMRSAVYFPVGRRSITSASMCKKIGFSMSHIEHNSAGL